MATQGYSFKQFINIVPRILASRAPVMGHGPHGIGKSELVYQLAQDIIKIMPQSFRKLYKEDYVFPVIERRASQMEDVGDVVGVPEITQSKWKTDQTTFAATEWFQRACHEPCILFFDEVDRANTSVRQSLMELTDSRKIAGFDLHPDTFIIAMVNGGSHDTNNSYQVGELDPAEHDRWWHANLAPTVDDWLTWADGRVLPVVWDFIKQNPGHLEHHGDFDPNKVYPSRRSVARFDKCLRESIEAGVDLLAIDENGNMDMALYFIGEGFIGQEAALAFKDFAENFSKQVTVEDILSGKKKKLVKGFQLNDSNAMIDKISASEYLTNGLDAKQTENLAKFIYSIQAELAMKAWEKFTNVNPEVVKALWKVNVAKGLNFGGYIAKVIGTETE